MRSCTAAAAAAFAGTCGQWGACACTRCSGVCFGGRTGSGRRCCGPVVPAAEQCGDGGVDTETAEELECAYHRVGSIRQPKFVAEIDGFVQAAVRVAPAKVHGITAHCHDVTSALFDHTIRHT